MCFEFCLGNGLDLFALLDSECRCGASRLNRGVWGDEPPRQGLQLGRPLSGCVTDAACPMRVYRWLGPFVSGGSVPEHLLMLPLSFKRPPSLLGARNVGNTIYVDSVVTGERISEAQEEDGEHNETDGALVQGESGRVEDPRWDRPRWLHILKLA